MTIVVNQGMLDTIVDDSDEGWDDNPITFSINVDPGGIIQDVAEFLGVVFDPDLVSFSAQDMPAMLEIAELWDDVIGYSINYVPNNDDEDIIINQVSNLPSGSNGLTFSTLHFPIIPDDADVYLRNTAIMAGQSSWRSAVHEFGHALGLQHPGDYDASEGPTTYANNAQFPEDTGQFSIMSYFDPNNFGSGWTSSNSWSRTEILTPMVYDILAVQQYYGVDTTARLGDTTYGFHSTADRSVYTFQPTQKPVLTIWDAGGAHDRLDVSGFTNGANQLIDLHEGSYSDVGGYLRNIGIAFGTWIEEAIGGSGSDQLIGNHLGNYLDGGGGQDTMRGELGDDTYVVDQASDTIVELLGEGTDTVNSTSTSYTLSNHLERLIYTGDQNVSFTGNGNGQNNEIRGAQNASNLIDGRAGDDQMFGGSQNDTYVVDSYGDQTIEAENAGNDTVRTALGNYVLQANVENLEFTGAGPLVTTGNELDNIITGNIGDDIVSGAGGNDTLNGNNGADRLSGDAGNDTLRGGAGNDLLDGGADDDDVDGGDGNDQVTGGTGDDLVVGGNGNDQVDGGDGTDIVLGGAGDDLIDGGSGNDRVSGGDGNDQASGGLGDDSVDGGAGLDQVYGGDGNDTVDGGAGNDQLAGDAGSDTMSGGDGSDNVSGGDGSDLLRGDAGDDTISGGAGDDYIVEGGGADDIDGGAGTDTVDYSGSTVGVQFTADSVGVSGDALGDRLRNIEVIIGTAYNDILFGDSGDNTVFGRDGNDVLTGGGGNDRLNGEGGADSMAGGVGDDVYIVDNALDIVTEIAGQGRDRVETTLATYALGANIEDLTYLGGTAFTGFGNGLANAIIGGASDDILRGGGGADALNGAGGNDTADYSTSAVAVVVNLATGINTGGDAAGDVLSSIENVTGSAFSDQLVGDANGNILDGGLGNDTINGGGGADRLISGGGVDSLIGGAGDDTYVVSANGTGTITEIVGGGIDTVETFQSTATLASQVENLTFLGTGNFRGTGNSLDNSITGGSGSDNIKGGSGNDRLFGLAGSDTLFGEGGNDVLDGGLGADVLDDSTGDDTFVFHAGDGGQDTVRGFTAGGTSGDIIQILGTTWTGLADVLAHLGAGTNSNATVIQLDATTSILLRGVSSTQLTEADFLFA